MGIAVLISFYCGDAVNKIAICGVAVIFGVRYLCFSLCGVRSNEIICGAVVSSLVFLRLQFSMLTSSILGSFSGRLLSHVHGLSCKRAFPVSTSPKPI